MTAGLLIAFSLAALRLTSAPGGSPLVLRLSASESPNSLTFKMMPQASISGTLVDVDGDPVRDAGVNLLRHTWSGPELHPSVASQAQTDEEGRFRLPMVAPGTYYLSAQPRSTSAGTRSFLDNRRQPFREREVPTYYKDSLSFEHATPILVKAGQQLEGMTFTLEKAGMRHASGMIRANALRSGSRVLLIPEGDGGPVAGVSAPVNQDGSFRIDAPPGRYELALVPFDTGLVRKEVDLSAGDLDGVVLEPSELLNLDAHVQIERSDVTAKPLDVHRLFLAGTRMKQGNQCEFDDSGNCKFEGILPDRYQILADIEQPSFVKRILIDGQVQSGRTLDLTNRRARSLEVILSSRVAAIDGRISAEHELTAGITIVLESAVGDSNTQSEAAAPQSKFAWKALAPGSYRLYAFEDFDPDVWGNPELKRILDAKSITVNLTEGELKKATVPLISAKQFEAAVAQTSF